MLTKFAFLAFLALLTTALCPGTGIRSRIVSVLCVTVQAALIAAIIAAATFELKPEWTPEGVDELVAPAIVALTPFVPDALIGPHPYLALGIVIGVVGIPALVVLDMIRNLASVVALLHRIARQCRKPKGGPPAGSAVGIGQ